MQNYKWFKPNEIISLDPELVYWLDKAREMAGVPFVITSGFRTKEQNTKAKGVTNSLHMTGQAVDLRIKNNEHLARIVYGLLSYNCFEIVIEKTHVHVEYPSDNIISKLFIKYA